MNMKFILLIHFKIPTTVGILTSISKIHTTPALLKQEKSLLLCILLSTYDQLKFEHKNSLIAPRPGLDIAAENYSKLFTKCHYECLFCANIVI